MNCCAEAAQTATNSLKIHAGIKTDPIRPKICNTSCKKTISIIFMFTWYEYIWWPPFRFWTIFLGDMKCVRLVVIFWLNWHETLLNISRSKVNPKLNMLWFTVGSFELPWFSLQKGAKRFIAPVVSSKISTHFYWISNHRSLWGQMSWQRL